MVDSPITILKAHNVKVTKCRVDVVRYFLDASAALSLADLERHFKEYNRVTLYRTLNSFSKSGILHQIPVDEASATYGLCQQSNHPNQYVDNHIHFKCNSCGQVECLDSKEIPQVNVPKGYTKKKVNLIVDGLCPKCGCEN